MAVRTLVGALVAALFFVTAHPVEASDLTVVAKKTATPIPSPSPKWPPQGFKGKDGVFAKVATFKELTGLLSAKKTMPSVVKQCKEFACGAVIAAAETGCVWWEVTSNVFRSTIGSTVAERLGSLVTSAAGSGKKSQTLIYLVSSQKIEPEVYISQIRVTCHRSSSDKPPLGHVYTPVATPTPSPSASN